MEKNALEGDPEVSRGGRRGRWQSARPGSEDADTPLLPLTRTASSLPLCQSAAPVSCIRPPNRPPLQLRPESVTRELTLEGSTLVLNFAAVDMRTLRAAVGTFCDLLGLATRTLEAFGPPATVAAAAAVAAVAAEADVKQQQ